VLTANIAKNLNLELKVTETSSVQSARKQAFEKIEQNVAVGLKLDAFHLEYFMNKIHFAAHYVAMFGYDDSYAYLVDTIQQGGLVKTSLKSLELARNEKGPMSSRNLMYTIRKKYDVVDMQGNVRNAINSNALEYLKAPISNISYRGIYRAASEIRKWFNTSAHVKEDFKTMALLMEKAGTGGALFRNLYRDFLWEACNYISNSSLKNAHLIFSDVSSLWNQVSTLFEEVGLTGNYSYIEKASKVLIQISELEREAMEELVEL
jgi:hypothetical protein